MKSTDVNPLQEYDLRWRQLLAEEFRHKQRSNIFAGAKLIAISLMVIAAILLVKYRPSDISILLAPVALILLLFVLHERTLASQRRCTRLQSFYSRGLARLDNQWAGTGQAGERFLDPSHPYARDLDLFGSGGLFELLCTARTRAGEETLAAWLLTPAPIEEILARQAAVGELQPRLDFREQLSLAGEDIALGASPDALTAWGEGSATQNLIFSRLAPVLAALWILGLLGWAVFGWGAAPLGISVLNLLVTYRFRAQVERDASAIEQSLHNLDLLAAVFFRIEQQKFTVKKLVDLQTILSSGNEPASSAIARLHRRMAWFESHENLFVKFADLFIFWTAQWASAIDEWRVEHGTSVRDWLRVAGEMEALLALASYAYEHPADTFPQFIAAGPYLEMEGFSHPLIQRATATANDLKLDANLQLLIISGPNMAGKSTFIRGVGVNTVLALAGAPVCARRMVMSALRVTASICILDSLQGGLSRFYAEILRLKLIDEQSRGSIPVLFLLDELLSGTNSQDRRAGTESFVHSLLARRAIGLVTTHDLALAKIAEKMAGRAANFHFEDTFENGELHFDYRLTPGVVATTNALQLMRSVGLDV